MKKDYFVKGLLLLTQQKIWLKMKLITILLFLVTFCLQANNTYSQNTTVNIDLENATMTEIFREIEKQSEFRFFFNNTVLSTIKKQSIKTEEKTITEVLDQLFKGSDISYRLIDKYIVITSKRDDMGFLINQSENLLQVSGLVTDETGEPMSGVTVRVKGVNMGTVTDIDGKYSIAVPMNRKVLVFSFIGFITQEVSIGNQSVINVQLKEDAISLSDVVVVGYGVTKKSDLTGSVASVTLDDVSRQPVLRVEEALRGKATGVQITQQNGAPGGSMKIRVRGANSVNGNNDPLYVIDGFVGGDFTMVNPNDIESISILKDASATSMYGSRGSNGVVLVTTKSAKEGEMKITYDGFVSIDRAAKTLDVLNATEYMTVTNERQAALGANPYFTQEEINAAGKGVNWQDEILRTAATQNHQLSMNGGQKNIKYYISTSYQDQQGVVENSYYKKYGLRANINSKVRENFDMILNLNGNYFESRNNATYDGRDSPMGSALIFPPNIAIKDENGEYNVSPGGYGPITSNPVFSLNDGDNDGYGMKFLGNLTLNWTIIDGLKLSVSGGADLSSTKSTSLSLNNKLASVSTCIASVYDGMHVSYQNTNQLSYNKVFNDIHKVDAALVYEQQKYVSRALSGYSTGFPTIALGVNALGLGSSQTTSSGYTEWSLQSYLGRLNYTLLDRYLFTASMRIDGSSKFSKGNKYGYFPSGAVAWRMSDEKFIKDLNVFENLKLRASYGMIGSQAINPYATLQTMAYSGSGQNMNYYFDNTSNLYIGISPNSPANPNLKWETTSQMNFGIDFSVLNGRLSGTVDYYYKKTKDLLFSVSVPDYLYGGSQLQNVGSLRNSGWEFMLNGVIVDNRDWHVSTSANLSLNRNKVLNMGEETEIFVSPSRATGWHQYTGYSILQVGESMGQMRGLNYLGVWKTAEAAEAAKFGKIPGDSKYEDLNGDYVIDGNDMKVIGNAMPKFTWAWNTSVSYKDFDLNMVVNGVQGNDVWNFTRFLYSGMFADCIIPTNKDVLNRWSPTNENSDYPNFSSSNVVEKQSSRWMESGSYLRLSNLTLGYTFSKLKRNTFVKDAKIYVSGQNLFTITKYKGYNPEGSNTQSGQDIAMGFDETGYPVVRSYTIGVKFAF